MKALVRVARAAALAVVSTLSMASAAEAAPPATTTYTPPYQSSNVGWLCYTDGSGLGTSTVFAGSGEIKEEPGSFAGFADGQDRTFDIYNDSCQTNAFVNIEYEVGPRVKSVPIELTLVYEDTGFELRNVQARDYLEMNLLANMYACNLACRDSGYRPVYEYPARDPLTREKLEQGDRGPAASLDGTYVMRFGIGPEDGQRHVRPGTWRLRFGSWMNFFLARVPLSAERRGVRAEYRARFAQIRVG